MQNYKNFFKYIYSSKALDSTDFDNLVNQKGIFRKNFFDHPNRKNIIEKFASSLKASNGGVFLLSGYRGTGKTSFLNYVLYKLKKENPSRFVSGTFNLSAFHLNLKFEIMSRIIFVLNDMKNRFPSKIRSMVSRINKKLLWARNISFSIENTLSAPPYAPKAGVQYGKTEKDNIYYLENKLQKILNAVHRNTDNKIILILDELDKIPFYGDIRQDAAGQSENGVRQRNEQEARVDRLVKMLSEIKYFLFESKVVFILVVNKDIFDLWKYRQSEKDLFMNLVTNMIYIPAYFYEELELHPEFPFELGQDIETSYPSSPYAIKKYFQLCAYYESYANPRLFFQVLSRNISSQSLLITRNEAQYLSNKVRLYEMNELLYNYFYRNKEVNFRQFQAAIDELADRIIKLKAEENKSRRRGVSDDLSLYRHYQEYLLQSIKVKDISPEEFWNIEQAKSKKGNFLYHKLEAFINYIRENDPIDNFPATNYIIRRLTDFLKIIEQGHFISIQSVLEKMRFEEYEIKDSIGQYLIWLLIPINLIILKNSKVIDIVQNNIYYNYQTDVSAKYFHDSCKYELDGYFKDAFLNYNEYINREFNCMDAIHRKLRLLYYMIILGFNYRGHKIDIKSEWKSSLEKMEQYFSLDKNNKEGNVEYANFYFYKFFYYEFVAGGDKERFKEQEDAEDNYDKAIESDPYNASTHMWKGYYLFWKKKYVAALDAFNVCLKYDNDPIMLIRKADTQVKLAQYEPAWDTYMEAIDCSTSWLHNALLIFGVYNMLAGLDKLKAAQKSKYLGYYKNSKDILVNLLRNFIEDYSLVLLDGMHYSLLNKYIDKITGVLGIKRKIQVGKAGRKYKFSYKPGGGAAEFRSILRFNRCIYPTEIN